MDGRLHRIGSNTLVIGCDAHKPMPTCPNCPNSCTDNHHHEVVGMETVQVVGLWPGPMSSFLNLPTTIWAWEEAEEMDYLRAVHRGLRLCEENQTIFVWFLVVICVGVGRVTSVTVVNLHVLPSGLG